MTTTFADNVHCAGASTLITALDANGSIDNADIDSAAAIAATKMEHQFGVGAELAESTTNIAAVTRMLHVVHGATGEIVDFEVALMVAAITDTYTVDIHKSTAAGAFATVYTTAIALSAATVVRTATGGTLDATKTDLVAGDILEVIVTTGVTGGTPAKGLVGTLTLREDPA